MVSYDSKRLEREHFLFNLPDHDIDTVSHIISEDLKLAGVGKKPFIIIAYSLGGVVARNIILYHLSEALSQLKGVAFVASPLKGSTMR